MRLLLIFTLAVAGCGPSGPPTFAVRGKVELANGDVRQLAGNHVEAARVDDPSIRASGVIAADGTFALETSQDGWARAGAREGEYRARIVPTAEDESGRRLASLPVARRFLRFGTSGLGFRVPVTGDVVLRLTAK